MKEKRSSKIKKVVILSMVLLGMNELFLRESVSARFTDAKKDPEAIMQELDPFLQANRLEPVEEISYCLKNGDIAGQITIPRLGFYRYDIVYHSSDINNDWKITTPGYLSGYGMFGEADATLVGAHNYQLFHDLPTMEIGDEVIVETEADTFVYEVSDTIIYQHEHDDYASLIDSISPYSLILMTCYPIDQVETEDRYLVIATLRSGCMELRE